MKTTATSVPAPAQATVEAIAARIAFVRGEKVLLEADLAPMYDVTIKRLNEQVRRNAARFPADFLFQLTADEWEPLGSQFATLKAGRGHCKYLPCAFTEHGALMAANFPNSARASDVAIFVVRVRAIVRLAAVKQRAGATAQ